MGTAAKAFLAGGTVMATLSFVEAYSDTADEELLDEKYNSINPKITIYSHLVRLQNYRFISDEFQRTIDNILEILNDLFKDILKNKEHIHIILNDINNKMTDLVIKYQQYSDMMENPEKYQIDVNAHKEIFLDWRYKGALTSNDEIKDIEIQLKRFNELICKNL